MFSVCYNATSARVGGGLSYAMQQVAALSEQQDVTLTLLTSPWNDAAFQSLADGKRNLTIQLVELRSAASRFAWEQFVLPFHAKRFDCLVCPGNFGPFLTFTPTVVILQNPNYVGIGRQLPQNRSLARRLKIAASFVSMRRADRVVTISRSLDQEFAKERLLRNCVRDVVLSGAPDLVTADSDLLDSVLQRLPDKPERYIVSVANDYAHKRLDDIALAFGRLSPEKIDALVFVGDISAPRQSELSRGSGSRSRDVYFLGSVGSRAAVSALYEGASIAVSASELEAFPLTPHEAGSMGCPLVLTNIAPHKELAADHAHFFEVGQVDQLVTAINMALATHSEAKWSWNYSWSEHAAELTRLMKTPIDNHTH